MPVFNKIKLVLLPDSLVNRVMLVLFSIIVMACLFTYYYLDNTRHTVVPIDPKAGLSRDYKYSPFNMSDAFQYCVAEARGRLGPALQRYAMNDISSFYNEKKSIFFVVLNVDVGSIRYYREALIYCDVDPRQYKVSYYKELYPGEGRSILSRTIEFFSEL